MKDTITQVGLVLLGIFIVAVLLFGDTGSLKTNLDGVQDKIREDITSLGG